MQSQDQSKDPGQFRRIQAKKTEHQTKQEARLGKLTGAGQSYFKPVSGPSSIPVVRLKYDPAIHDLLPGKEALEDPGIREHSIREGDTLYGITAQYFPGLVGNYEHFNAKMQEIADLNRLGGINGILLPGLKLQIPMKIQASPNLNDHEYARHIVRPNDNFWSITEKYFPRLLQEQGLEAFKDKMQEIAEFNGLLNYYSNIDPSKFSGRPLLIPLKSKEVKPKEEEKIEENPYALTEEEKQNLLINSRDRLEDNYLHQGKKIFPAPAFMSSEDAIYELIAHDLAYKNIIHEDAEGLLRTWGYKNEWAQTIDDQKSGFFAGLLLPEKNPNLPPIIAFRGTEPQFSSDLRADMDPYAVGYTSFMINYNKIQGWLNKYASGKKVNVTGHSLGGALAQHAAVSFPAQINKVIVFQSPGINQEQAEKFNRLPDHLRPSFRNHIVKGDVVDAAGSGRLLGEYILHNPKGISALAAHGAHITTPYPELYNEKVLPSKLVEETSLIAGQPPQKKFVSSWSIQDALNAVAKDADPKVKPVEPAKPAMVAEASKLYHQYPFPNQSKISENVRAGINETSQVSLLNQLSVMELKAIPYQAQEIILYHVMDELITISPQSGYISKNSSIELVAKRMFEANPQLRNSTLLKSHQYYNYLPR